MAPILSARGVSTGVLDLLRPRDTQSSSPPVLPPPIAAIAARIAARLPSRIVNPGATPALGARQDIATTTVPGGYPALHSGPDPGTVVGIVLGSVGGFLLLLWLFYTCFNLGNPSDAESYGTASVVSTRHRSRSRRHHHHHRSPRRETVEIRTTSRGPERVVVDEPGERIVVEETVRRSASRAPPPPRVVDDDDEVVVIEEHSPPRRHKSKRRSSGSSRRDGGYRDIDPDRFAGGDAPIRHVRRSRDR